MALGREYLSPQYLRPPTVYLTAASTKSIFQPLRLAQVTLTEALAPIAYQPPGRAEFRRRYAHTNRAYSPNPIRFFHQAARHVGVSFADRRANQLLRDMNPSFKEEYQTTLELIDHHGKSHVKRVKAGIQLLDEHTSEIHIPRWIKDAQLRFAAEHDANQAYQEYRILQGELSPNIDSKYGHGIGGAVMSLALYKDYARSLHISEDQAKRISFATAIMEISHDVPSQIRQAMGIIHQEKQKSARELREEGGFEALRMGFENATLDLFTLSPKDMIDLLQDIKTRKVFDTPYGLGPVFEKEYAAVLAELAEDTTPLFENISEKDKTAIQYATLIAVISDMMDMILPNDEAFARMFTVPRAIKFPLAWKLPRHREDFLPKTPETLQPFSDFFAQYGPEYWEEAQKLSIEELTVLRQILNGKAITNAERKLLEAFDIGNIVQGTQLAHNTVIAGMIEHYQAMTLLDIRHQVTFFMKGDREAITEHVDGIFNRQLLAIQKKLGENHTDIPKWEEKLSEEADFVMECLSAKETGIHVYDPEEIASFNRVAKLVERAFWTQQYQQLSRRQKSRVDINAYILSKLEEYETRYAAGERPVTPTHNYHSTGDINNARTMYAPQAA